MSNTNNHTPLVDSKQEPLIYIYALKDPFTGEVRYIGKSIRPKERLMNQCNERSNTYRCHWIQSVIAQGGMPIQIIIETLPHDSHWQSCEQMWIAYGRAKGWKLTNCTDGGDGVVNLSGESKERMLKTWKGRKHKPESLLKIGAATSRRRHSDATKAKMSKTRKNREISPRHRKSLSVAVRKFNDAEVQEVRERLKNGEKGIDLAHEFRVSRTTITNIKMGHGVYSLTQSEKAEENAQ